MIRLATLLLIAGALAGCRAPAVTAGARSQCAMVVIAPESLHPALIPFIEFKQKDLPTALVSLERLLQQYPQGVDDAERVKLFLWDMYQKRGMRYALLAGDADTVPVRYMCLDRMTTEAFHYAFYPSDLYYSDLLKSDGTFEDWNGAREGFHAGYFGEVRGEFNKKDPINFDSVDYRPEIAVGRWPVSTPGEADAIVTKTIAYESRARSGDARAPRAGLATIGGWVDCRAFMDRLAGKLPPPWNCSVFYDGKTPPGEKDLVEFINNDAALLLHAGHGHDHGWEGSLHSGSIAKMHNSGRYPVVMSAGCSTARFATLPPYESYCDIYGKVHAGTNNGEIFHEPPPPPAVYARDKFNLSGFGESLVRARDAGAVAYIGCNTGSQPCGLTLMESFVDALAAPVAGGARHRLGDLWSFAICKYYEKEHLAALQPNADWYPPSIFFQGMKFMLFGDPSLQLP